MSTSPANSGLGKQEWNLAAENAKRAAASAGEVASHVASAVGGMATQAVSNVGKKADELTANAGAGIQEFSRQIERKGPQSGVAGSASRAVAQTVRDGGEYLENAKLSGMSDDVTRLIRQYPLPTILLALGLGWFAARMMKR